MVEEPLRWHYPAAFEAFVLALKEHGLGAYDARIAIRNVAVDSVLLRVVAQSGQPEWSSQWTADDLKTVSEPLNRYFEELAEGLEAAVSQSYREFMNHDRV